jgi:hypothetical protein
VATPSIVAGGILDVLNGYFGNGTLNTQSSAALESLRPCRMDDLSHTSTRREFKP